MAISGFSAAPVVAADGHGPLVLAPPPQATPWPSPVDVAIELGASALVAGAVWGLALPRLAPDGGFATYIPIAGGLLLPPAGLLYAHERAMPLDAYFAAVSGGAVGLLAGSVVGMRLQGDPNDPNGTANPLGLAAALSVGQALGATAGYNLYLQARPHLTDLDKLPEHRTDDPNNWDRWKERHHNE